jgi:hypothetical protein
MILKVGKTYLTRDGQRVLIEAETTRHGMYTMQGVYVEGGHCCDPYNHRALGVTWRRKDGRMSRARHRLDLVVEEQGKSPLAEHDGLLLEIERGRVPS